MSASWAWGLIIVPIYVWFKYLDLKAAFGPQRMDIGKDGLSMAVGILILLWFFKATVFEHPEARFGWIAGLLLGAAVGFFDLRRTRIRNTPDGILVWSSRIVTALFLLAGFAWSASHSGHSRISFDEASQNPTAMFFCTTVITYAVVYINGLYSGRRFASAPSPRGPLPSRDRSDDGSRRRGRR